MIGSHAHWDVRIIFRKHYYANIDGITSKLEYWKENWVFDRLFCWCQKMRKKLWLCQFFKFSTMKQFWALKLIAWVDIRVVSIFYSFQSVRVDLGGELEKLTKYSTITCVIHIQKRLDLLFHPVFPKFVLCCKNHTQIAL